jgi:hypothetical protein
MATHNYTPAQQSVITEALNLVQERAATECDFMTSPSQTFDYFRLFYAGKQEKEIDMSTILGPAHQPGIVVGDIEAASANWDGNEPIRRLD